MRPMIQFGAGGNILPGWQNFDADLDVTKWPLPFETGSVDRCMAEHLAEHCDSREALGFFTEVHRILAPGGFFRVCCPVVGPWLERDHARDLLAGNGHKMILTEETMRTLLWAAGFELNKIRRDVRQKEDGHYRVIGSAKDDLETCRIQAYR